MYLFCISPLLIGILADEMGLGKTVQMLACVSPLVYEHIERLYICVCVRKSKPVRVRACVSQSRCACVRACVRTLYVRVLHERMRLLLLSSTCILVTPDISKHI